MRTIAVTGGIGSGKSEVCRYLASRGYPVYDSDSRAKALYGLYPELLSELEHAFGLSLRDADGQFDRVKLAAVAFGDTGALARIEKTVHPYALRDFVAWRDAREAEGVRTVIYESAVAMSKPMFRTLADFVLLVDAELETRIARVMSRDGCSREEVLARVAAQNFDNIEEDAVIMNDSDTETLHARVERMMAIMIDNNL